MNHSERGSLAIPEDVERRIVGHVPGSRSLGAAVELFASVGAILLAVLCLVLAVQTRLVRIDPSQDRALASHVLASAARDFNRASFEALAKVGSESRDAGVLAGDRSYRVDFEVSEAKLGLLKIRAVLKDRHSGKELERMTTWRAR